MSREPGGAVLEDPALLRLIGVESFQQSARAAGLSGGLLLILVALIAWPRIAPVGLADYWVAWAVTPAVLAAFGGPYLSRCLLSRRHLARWRLLLMMVMALNTSAWAFAAAFAGLDVGRPIPMIVAGVALAVALLPALAWLPGLIAQLSVHLLVTLAFALLPDYGVGDLALPLGTWAVLSVLAFAAVFYSRRWDAARGDVHYLRFESSELQKESARIGTRLREAEDRCKTLEAELAEILDLAEDANRAKTEFLATMSHEIRTPLNGILPILEMLRDTPLNEEQQKLARTAHSSSRHLLRIINDILDFAKVESGKLELEAIEIDIRELVGSVTELMGSGASNRGLRLSISLADNLPQVVRGDPIRLRQVLINLVSNAIKFTEEGGIRIEVSRGQSSQKEIELLFAVADTGIGMTEETADRLFQSFTQADASTTRKHGGTGLGLVICKRLVELMGGKIGVRSTVGQGSTFWFLVPLRKSVMDVPSARRDLHGIRALTLIPDPERSTLVGDSLQQWQMEVHTAADCDAAVTELRSTIVPGHSWNFDLMLIDGAGIEQRLPGLLAEIRGNDRLESLKVVVTLQLETMAHKLKRDFNVIIVNDLHRPEPLRRLLYRMFDVEARYFGNPDMRAEEVYDDLNLATGESTIVQPVSAPVDEPNTGSRFVGSILLVEDNPVNLVVFRKALHKLGLDCETATNGRDALGRVERQRFDLVFMDCQMPEMDGYEATRQIRAMEMKHSRLPVPIVAMTANAMSGDREKCIAAGMDDYLAKPVSIDQLRTCVSAWLRTIELDPGAGAQAASATVESPSVDPGPPILDQDVLAELREIMEDEYLELLATYLENAPGLLRDTRAALSGSDVDALVIPIHSLKSSSANVGATQLAALAKIVEEHARNGELSAAAAAFGAVEVAFQDAQLALKAHVDKATAA